MMPTIEKTAVLRVERRALATLRPHPRNPRQHPEPGSSAWSALKRSVEHDYFDPIVVNVRNDTLVSGHLRHKILVECGFTHADVSLVDYDEPTHLARLIAANTLLGEWEESLLASIAHDLESAGLAPGLAGWDEKQLTGLLEGPMVTDDSATAAELVSQAEELQREWQVAPGDLYAVGEHRLLCGDCTIADHWEQLLGDRLADLVWTDPPYNVAYDSIQRRRIEHKAEIGKQSHVKPEAILNDHLPDARYEALLTSALTVAFARTKPGGVLYVAHADSQCLVNRRACVAAGWKIAQCLVWVKNAFTLGRQDYQWQHEPILYGWKPGAAHYWQGGFDQSTLIDDEEKNLTRLSKPELVEIIQRLRNDRATTIVREPRNVGNGLHPTIKPLPLVARQIWNSSHRGETVLELFGGSGTTLLASEQTGRRCVATELDPKYAAVILERARRHGLAIEKIRAAG